MQNQDTLKRRYFVFGVIVVLIAFGSMILCLNTEAHFRGQIFVLAFRHGAVNRNWGKSFLAPSFDDRDITFLWKIQEPSHITDLTDVPPEPSITKSDADLLIHMASVSPPSNDLISEFYNMDIF